MTVVEFCPLQGFKAVQESWIALANRWRGMDPACFDLRDLPPQKTSPSHALSVLPFIHLSTEPVNQSVSGSACSSVWQFEGLLGVFKQRRALNMEPFLSARNPSQMLHQHLFIKLVPARVNWLPLHKRWSWILTLLVLRYFSADLPQLIRQNASHPPQIQARSEDLNIIVNSWLSVFGLSLRQPFPPLISPYGALQEPITVLWWEHTFHFC